NITKVVSGSDNNTLEIIFQVYDSIINAGIHKASTIKVAEAAKVIENAQRDINIAFMNELSIVFNKMNIDTNEVLAAAGTKWNFLNFKPGLVGGHCIGVDPYYFVYKAEQLGYHSQIILAGRKINDNMGKHVTSQVVKMMIQAKQHMDGAKVAILGLTFKENIADVRNTRVIDIAKELKDYGVEVLVHDPMAEADEVLEEFDIQLVEKEALEDLDAIIYAVPHQVFTEEFTLEKLKGLYRNDKRVFIDVKSTFTQDECEAHGFRYWSL